MKKWMMLAVFFVGLTAMPQAAHAVVGTQEQPTALTRKAQKKQAQLEKRLDRVEKKLKKRSARQKAQRPAYNLWDDGNFRLGVLLVLAALGLGLVAALGILSGLFNFLGGLLILAGLVLIVLALIENA